MANEAVLDRPFLVTPPQRIVDTSADTDLPRSAEREAAVQDRVLWQSIIDDRLTHWLRNRGELADEGIEAPSDRILRLAIDYAEQFRDEGLPGPTAVFLDPNGGVVFERRIEPLTEKFHFWDDGAIEYLLFEGTTLRRRGPLG